MLSTSTMKCALNRVNRRRLRRNPKPVDVVEKERSSFQHWLLEKSIVNLCLANKYEPLTNRHIDLLCNVGTVSVIFEVKACPLDDIAGPVRLAAAQLLEYRYLYRGALMPTVKLCIVSDRRPRNGYEWTIGYLESLSIGLIWRNDGDDGLNCNHFTWRLLGDLFPQMNNWEARPLM
jgi:hypothetical protein